MRIVEPQGASPGKWQVAIATWLSWFSGGYVGTLISLLHGLKVGYIVDFV